MDTRSINIKINDLGIGDDYPVRIMGILNVSGESFYRGSVVGPERIGEIARGMIEAGAAFLDVGGRSTAPGVRSISVEEEKERVVSGLDALFRACDTGRTLISIDTQFAAVASAALGVMRQYGREGCALINDVSCLSADSRMAEWASGEGVPLVIMAGSMRPGDALGIAKTLAALERGIERLVACGFDTARNLIIDPAIGRWVPEKTTAYDLDLIRRLAEFRRLGLPILVGISRKSFVGGVIAGERSGAEGARTGPVPAPDERLAGSLSATAIAVYNGAHIVRTHDVDRNTFETIAIASAVRNAHADA